MTESVNPSLPLFFDPLANAPGRKARTEEPSPTLTAMRKYTGYQEKFRAIDRRIQAKAQVSRDLERLLELSKCGLPKPSSKKHKSG